MELDIQKFFQNPDQLQFEFPPFPTSYLRLAAHRVAQHYGLVTTALDNGAGALDGSDIRILATRTAESRFPHVCLSEIPVKQPENGRPEGFKIAIKARPTKRGSGCGGGVSGVQQSLQRSVEERKEEYDKARARIFNSPSSSDSEDSSSLLRAPSLEGSNTCVNRNEPEVTAVNNNSSRVAIIRDREKDRYDPDYDRSYERYVVDPAYRYVRFMPNPMPMHMPFHDGGFMQMPRGHQANLHYGHPPAMSPFINSPVGYTPWPNSPAMNYAQSLHGPDTHLFRHPSASNP